MQSKNTIIPLLLVLVAAWGSKGADTFAERPPESLRGALILRVRIVCTYEYRTVRIWHSFTKFIVVILSTVICCRIAEYSIIVSNCSTSPPARSVVDPYRRQPVKPTWQPCRVRPFPKLPQEPWEPRSVDLLQRIFRFRPRPG